MSGRSVRKLLSLGLCLVALLPGCGDDNPGPAPTNTGQSCSSPDQCYAGVKSGELLGEAECLSEVEGGYCTHSCTVDSDCCAAAGECAGPYAEVCSPYESSEGMHCLLSCEDDDVAKTTVSDSEAYCQSYAGPAFHCHSSGGGSENRKVCTP